MDNNKNIDIENTENIEIFESDFDLVADEFCKKLGLENLTQASQSQWNAYLIKCNRDIISRRRRFIKYFLTVTLDNCVRVWYYCL